MEYTFRNCNDADIPFLLELKEKSFRWYIETLYGWNVAVQTDIIKKELATHQPDMRIIQCEGKDAECIYRPSVKIRRGHCIRD
jgi:hypothetical protein